MIKKILVIKEVWKVYLVYYKGIELIQIIYEKELKD